MWVELLDTEAQPGMENVTMTLQDNRTGQRFKHRKGAGVSPI